MKITILDFQTHNILDCWNYPLKFETGEMIEELSSIFNFGLYGVNVLIYSFEGICVVVYESKVETTFKFHVEFRDILFTIPFCLAGHVQLSLSGADGSVIKLTDKMGMLATELNSFGLRMGPGSKAVFIHLTPKYFARIIHRNLWTDQLFTPFNMTPAMSSIVCNLLKCKGHDRLKHILFESKILELIYLQFMLKERLVGNRAIDHIRSIDMVGIQLAKRLIEQNIRNPYSIKELARKVGMNDFKLKKSFKTAFGYTLFGYLNEVRMEQARQMLLQERSVTDIAYEIGYKNAHHFTAAFKKRYGVVPSKLRLEAKLIV